MIRKHFRTALILVLISGINCHVERNISINVIPLPQQIIQSKQLLSFSDIDNLTVSVAGELTNELNYFIQKMEQIHGIKLQPNRFETESQFHLILDTLSNFSNEGYHLSINESIVKLTGNQPAGIFYGIQTILQLANLNNSKLYFSQLEILDTPERTYRGVMLDIARHFISKDDIKQLIDQIAFYKFNHLHLHLSDDQGWRIEIKSWPNLTGIGGRHQVGGGQGDFLSQEDFTDLVVYALERHITIVPEIDMPGHTHAALVSYPQLTCDGQQMKHYTGIEVGFSTLCVNKEITYQFVDDVVREISAITPGKYFHMGGDESNATNHQDYLKFVNRTTQIIAKYNKQSIGWDETAKAPIDSNHVIQFWHSVENAKLGLTKGAKILFSPASKTYMDMKYDTATTLGLSWAGLINIQTSYLWDFTDFLPEIDQSKILGIEAPLWTETIENKQQMDYMYFPRLTAMAEIGWTAVEKRNWDSFQNRLGIHGQFLDQLNINFHRSNEINWSPLHNNK